MSLGSFLFLRQRVKSFGNLHRRRQFVPVQDIAKQTGHNIDLLVCPCIVQETDVLFATKNITSCNGQSGYGNLFWTKSCSSALRVSTGCGTSSSCSVANGACKCWCISSADVPRNGAWPVSIFQSVAPSE